MPYTTEKIRNVAVCGHGSTGKTTLVEQILANGGVIPKAETVDSGRTVSDYTNQEIERKISIHTSLSHVDWKETKINLFDTPGLADFIGEVVTSFRAAEAAVVLMGARSGIQIETIKLWRRLNHRNMPRMIFINKMEKAKADFESILAELKDFKVTCIPVTMPMGSDTGYEGVIDLLTMKAYPKTGGGKEENAIDIPEAYREIAQEYHEQMIEAAAEGDDELTEKYFDEGTLTIEEVRKGLREGLFANKFVPVFCGSALENSGITPLMDFIAFESPSPSRIEEPCQTGEKARMISPDGDFSGVVFKTSIDQFSGKLSYIKCITGKLSSEAELYNPRIGKKEKFTKLYVTQGKKLEETKELCAGDVGVMVKMEDLETNDTLCSAKDVIHFKPLALPHPCHSIAIEAENQKEEDKLGDLLHRAASEDHTFTVTFNPETKQTVAAGMGELHLNVILDIFAKEYKVNVRRKTPKVAYRETITKSAEAEYTHKKQSGGHGQYGRVVMRGEPLPRGEKYAFENAIKGGSISKGYMPGIEKGLQEGMEEGFLAGYPLVDMKFTVLDGKEHPVDSSEMAFKMAAKNALRMIVEKSKPVLLEPIMNVDIFVDNQYLGDVLSDLSSKRGRVQGQETLGGDIVAVKAQVPHGEMLRYTIDLRSITSGTGAFEMAFSHYDPVTGKTAQDIIQAAQAEKESE